MASIYLRGSRLWMRVKQRGTWTSKRTPFAAGDEVKAQRYADRAQENIDARGTDDGPDVDTVSAYALGPWIEMRRDDGEDWSSDRGRLVNHVLPDIGDMPIADVRAKHIAALVRRLRQADLAPRTVRNIYFVARAMFRDAAIEGRVDTNPCMLTAAQLGGVVDGDPEWRAGALFTRDEAATLIADPRIPFDRRVVYALGLLAGLRPGEGAALRLRHYSPDVAPLGRLLVATAYSTDRSALKRTKTEAVRAVPVHPALAELLAVWIGVGWAAMVGRDPGPNDLLVPLPPETVARRTRRTGEPFRGWDYTGKRWREEDLPMLGWRRRSVYDARATFISLAVEDGADEEILCERVTHTKAKRRGAFDGYNRLGPKWEETCAEVAKLRIGLRPRVALPHVLVGTPPQHRDWIPSPLEGRNAPPREAGWSCASTGSVDEQHANATIVGQADPHPGVLRQVAHQVAVLATPLATASASSSENAGSGGGSRTPDDGAKWSQTSRRSDEEGGRLATDHDWTRLAIVASASHSDRRMN